MFDPHELEGRIDKNGRSLEALSIQNQALERQVEELFQELSVTGEQIALFLSNKENFTEENWAYIKQEQQRQHEKLLLQLAHIRSSKSVKEKRASQGAVQRHWLFVR
jgi:hypothetical protein